MEIVIEQQIKEFIKDLPNRMRKDADLNAAIRNLVIQIVKDAMKD